MLQKESLEFLKALDQNNNREWFAENKPWYEKSKKDVEKLIAEMIPAIAAFEPQAANLEPKKCLFRIYKDTRFSLDKTPYKTNFGVMLSPRSKEKSAGFYMHISPGECFLSCGYYMLRPDQLKAIRRGIYENFDALQAILNNKQFKATIGDFYRDEDVLQRVPNGFDKNHPAAEYLKLKHFYVCKFFTEKELFSDQFVEYAAGVYKIMQPLSEFLNELLEDID